MVHVRPARDLLWDMEKLGFRPIQKQHVKFFHSVVGVFGNLEPPPAETAEKLASVSDTVKCLTSFD